MFLTTSTLTLLNSCPPHRTVLDVHGRLQVRLQQRENDTWLGYIEDPRLNEKDDIGALYYVIAVIFIYGLSIVMMIASHIRKNKQDCQLRAYLKEMANLRKADRRDKVMERITALAAVTKSTTKTVFKNDVDKPAKGIFRMSSKTSLKLGGNKRQGPKDLSEVEVEGLKTGVWRGEGGKLGGLVGGRGGTETPVTEEEEEGEQPLMMKRVPPPSQPRDIKFILREQQNDDGNETCDSEYLDLPVDFSLDMNRLSPSFNASPLTSASATPSPPPRHAIKPMTKISFVDEGFLL
ncbi:hypothetical protein V1264_022987 [Littorina saxatilis]|uniref:Uncharacterized protein n=1 Tax=Littorina saxatilis TaxID=31220 RepID=A0AAN9B6D2_9CAEN